MKYAFYDFETSGLNEAFDSLLQVAAVLTDEDFNEIDSFNIRGRMKKEFPVPNAKALLVNGVTVDQLKNEKRSNFALIAEMQAKFRSWGEITFIGYNSIGFDEKFLRQSLYQSAFPPYLSNTNGNKRADALKIIHSAACVSPNSFVRPINDDTGKISFQLEKFAPANGIGHENAHDALSDVFATIGVCKLVKERCPEIWAAAMQTTSKQDVFNYIKKEQVFCASRYFRGKEYTNALAYLCLDPTYPNHAYFFDLTIDPELIFELDRSELKKYFAGKKKCFHKIKTNEQPILLDEKHLYISEEFKDVEPTIYHERMRKVKANQNFIEKIENLLIDMNEDKDYKKDQSEKQPEEKIFDGFPDSKDSYLAVDFHAAMPEKKYDFIAKVSDSRMKEFMKRVMFEEYSEHLPKNIRDEKNREIAKKILSMEKEKWLTVADAMSNIDDLREKEEIDMDKLQEIDQYIQELQDRFMEKENLTDVTNELTKIVDLKEKTEIEADNDNL